MALFEACSVFTRVTACSRADLPEETFYLKGFCRFVAAASALTATGRSERCRWVSTLPLRFCAFSQRTESCGLDRLRIRILFRWVE